MIESVRQGGVEDLSSLLAEVQGRIHEASSAENLEQIEVEVLGRKGRLTRLLRSIGALPPAERPAFGQRLNEARQSIEALLAERRAEFDADTFEARLKAESVDITLPGRFYQVGRKHPLTVTIEEVKRIFIGLGFEMFEGPEIEDYYYNFQALNYPREHPAMDEQMSFYITDDKLMRTQTTAVQARVMEKRQPPLRILTIGRCYRYEAVDATHSHTFQQVDGFGVDEGISFADLKGLLLQFAREMWGPNVKTRFRPDFFPFVEPGADFAVSCMLCDGQGCPVCKQTGWLEVAGAGLIHPNVLENVGYDSEKYTGFAFGFGIERMPMLKYGIDDLRLFYDNDLRFLRQL